MSEVHFYASGLSNVVIWGIQFVPKLYFRYSFSPQFSFHAFGLSEDYFQRLMMVWSELLMDVDLGLLIFRALGVIKINFPITRHVWSALLCIRYAKSFNLGYPVCPKTIFSGIRLVRSSFFTRLVFQKTFFNGSWWYEVSSMKYPSITDVDLVLLILRALSVIKIFF